MHLVDLARPARRPTWDGGARARRRAAGHAVGQLRHRRAGRPARAVDPARRPTSRRLDRRAAGRPRRCCAPRCATPASAPHRSAPIRPGRSGGSIRAGGTSRWSSTSPPSAARPRQGDDVLDRGAAGQPRRRARRRGWPQRVGLHPRARAPSSSRSRPARRARRPRRRAGARCASRSGAASTTAAAARCSRPRPGRGVGVLRPERAGRCWSATAERTTSRP